jgi:hypothetical protein
MCKNFLTEFEIRQVKVLHFIASTEVAGVMGIIKFWPEGWLHFADILKINRLKEAHFHALVGTGSLRGIHCEH